MRVRLRVLGLVLMFPTASAFAQGSQSGVQMPAGQMQMSMPENPLRIDHTREGSGTSWLPDESPMQGLMHQSGPWMLMFHSNAFLQFIKTATDRGDQQFGSINWFMGMAQRKAAGGQLEFRGMLSLEPLTVGRCGYPDLLQSGEFCNGAPLHDQQHPHNLFMELAADYRHALNDAVAFEVYGGPIGEPALGPTAFPHRLSAMPDPMAPISHHWLDSTHISFGVVTGGVYGRKWKAETSVFNGREPDDRRYRIELAAMDSYSGRFWFLPTSAWAFQISAGHIREAEAQLNGPREDVERITASATYQRLVNNRLWATTVAWGRNTEGGLGTSALFLETACDLTRVDTVFARGEAVSKTAGDLALTTPSTGQTFATSKVDLGYTRWLEERHGMKTGVGGSVGVSIVPSHLKPIYGSRIGGEFSVFIAIRTR